MCFQGFAHFACGHERLVEHECHLASDFPLYIKHTCPEYTTQRLYLEIQCGVGKWYCQRTQEGPALDCAFHQYYCALCTIRDLDAGIQTLQQSLERWVQYKQYEAAIVRGSSALLARQELEGHREYQFLVKKRSGLYQQKRSIAASVQESYESIHHLKAAILRREHFESLGVIPPAVVQPSWITPRLPVELQYTTCPPVTKRYPQTLPLSVKESPTVASNTADFNRPKQHPNMNTNRMPLTHANMPLIRGNAAGLPAQPPQPPQSKPRRKTPAKQRDLSYLLTAPPLKPVASTQPSKMKPPAKREPSGVRRSNRNHTRVNYAESSSSVIPSEDTSPSKSLYITTPSKMSNDNEDLFTSGNSSSKRGPRSRQTVGRISPFARYGSPRELINDWRERIGVAVPDAQRRLSDKSLNQQKTPNSRNGKKRRSAQKYNPFSYQKRFVNPASHSNLITGPLSGSPLDPSRRIFYGSRPEDDDPFQSDPNQHPRYLPFPQAHDFHFGGMNQAIPEDSTSNAKQTSQDFPQYSIEPYQQMPQYPPHFTYSTQTNREINPRSNKPALSPTQQHSIGKAQYTGTWTPEKYDEQDYLPHNDPSTFFAHLPQSDAISTPASANFPQKRKPPNSSQFNKVVLKRVRTSFPSNENPSPILDRSENSVKIEDMQETANLPESPYLFTSDVLMVSPQQGSISDMAHEMPSLASEESLYPAQTEYEYPPPSFGESNNPYHKQLQQNYNHVEDHDARFHGMQQMNPNIVDMSVAGSRTNVFERPAAIAAYVYDDRMMNSTVGANANINRVLTTSHWEDPSFNFNQNMHENIQAQPAGEIFDGNQGMSFGGGNDTKQHYQDVKNAHRFESYGPEGLSVPLNPNTLDLDQFMAEYVGSS